MSNDEMDRAHREDYAYERACRDAERAIEHVLSLPRGRHMAEGRQLELRSAGAILEREAAHIVAVWD